MSEGPQKTTEIGTLYASDIKDRDSINWYDKKEVEGFNQGAVQKKASEYFK